MKHFDRVLGSLLIAVLALGLSGQDAKAQSTRPWQNTREYFELMDARYADLTGQPGEVTRGTGFKPYERFRWFAQNRIDDVTGSMIPGERWEAWQQMRELEQQYGTRSNTWFNLGPNNVAGRCLAIEIHPTIPNIVYAGFASSGLWKSVDGGTTWVPLGDYLPTLSIGAIEIDATNPDHIYIGTGEGWGNTDAIHGVGLLESFDGGVTFQTTGYSYAMTSARDVYELEYNPATGTLMVAADNGLWRSTNSGASFTQIFPYGAWTDVEYRRGSTTTMYACGHSSGDFGFWTSTDDGATWTKTTVGVPTVTVGNCRFALTAANPDIIYWGVANLSNGSMLGLWKSTNGAASFTQIPAGNHYGSQGWYDLTIDVDPNNANRVFSGGVEFYYSTNGGTSFSTWAGNVHVDHHATAWAPSDPTIFWLGTDGGCYRSTNAGSNFLAKNTALTTMQFYAINQAMSQPTRAMGGTQDNGTYRYDNNPNWTGILGGDGFFCEIDFTNPQRLYGELYYGDHRRSTDGGTTMLGGNSGITDDGPWSTPTHMDYGNSMTLWTAHTSQVYKSTNGMASWTFMNNPLGLNSGRSIHQCRAVPNMVVVCGSARIWKTMDSGTTWTEISNGIVSGGGISDIHVHPTNPDIMVVTVQKYSSTIHQVQKTIDGGLSWFAIDAGLPDEPANTIEIDPTYPEIYYVGTDLGVYISFNEGASWMPFNTGLPHVVVSDLRVHDSARLLRAGTHGRGLWEVDISSFASVNERPQVENLTLHVFGNPASNSAVLRFGTHRPGDIKLGLFDSQGRLVKPLLEQFQPAIVTNHEVDLSDLPAGVYFARLESNGETLARKVVVEK
jgi:hypothetical protein